MMYSTINEMTHSTKKSKSIWSLVVITTLMHLWMNVLSAQRPNIVWIYSDDHTMQSIGAYGGQLSALDPTPNIDRLAKGGMIFNRCHVGNSICAPARATLLTGKHSHKHGKIENYTNQLIFQGTLRQISFYRPLDQ